MSAGSPSGTGDEDAVPYHLMPIAALLAAYSLYAAIGTASLLRERWSSPSTIGRGAVVRRALVAVASAVAYAYVTARVNDAVVLSGDSLFDPIDILGVPDGSNATVARAAYRRLSRIHHPDRGGDKAAFRRINLAYRALADDEGRRNYELHGHPDGPQRQTLSFALPSWLLYPEGNVAVVLVALYLSMFAYVAAGALRYVRSQERDRASRRASRPDAEHLERLLRPGDGPWEVLYAVATAPDHVADAKQCLEAEADDGAAEWAEAEKVLRAEGCWPGPPGWDAFAARVASGEGDGGGDPAVERNLLSILGRLHWTGPDAVPPGECGEAAAPDGRRRRRRVAALLDASLRIAMLAQSAELSRAVIGAIAAWNAGTKPSPRPASAAKKGSRSTSAPPPPLEGANFALEVNHAEIITPGEEETATGDRCVAELSIIPRKLPARVAKEIEEVSPGHGKGWWAFVRAEQIDGRAGRKKDTRPSKGSEGRGSKDMLIGAAPLALLKSGEFLFKAKVPFSAPSVPGKYKFFVSLNSLNIVGYDTETSVAKNVLDSNNLPGAEDFDGETEGEADEGPGRIESKKTK